jgi:hypothetical protein
VVYDIPSGEHRPKREMSTPRPMRALPRPQQGARVHFRMDTSFNNPPSRTRMIQDVLDRGSADGLSPDMPVEVRNRFNERWTGGFVIDAVVGDRYRLRRAWNGAVLPVHFKADDLRRTDVVAR